MKLPPDDLSRRIGAALARIQIFTGSSQRRVADDAGLSKLQMTILGQLVQNPGPRVGVLAKRLELTAGTISVALNALEEKGLAQRKADPKEHRAVLVFPTPKGKRIARDLDDWAEDRLAPIVHELGRTSAGQSLAALLDLIDAAERSGMVGAAGMCSRCRYFGLRLAKGKDPATPHHCGLLRRDIGAADLQINCPDFEAADPENLPASPSLLRP